MKTYIVTYQFRNYSKNYASFHEAIKTNYTKRQHPMESLWLIRTDETPLEIFGKLKPHLGDTDSIFVAEITDSHEGRMPKSMWEWLSNKKSEINNTENDGRDLQTL